MRESQIMTATPAVVATEALAAPEEVAEQANMVPEAAVEAINAPADAQAVVHEAEPQPQEDEEMEILRESLGGLVIVDTASKYVNQQRNRQSQIERIPPRRSRRTVKPRQCLIEQ